MSPKPRSRSTRQTRRFALGGQGDREVGRDGGLADAALGGEDGDQLAGGRVVQAAARAGDGPEDLVGALDGLAETGEVALLDDLAHARPQRLGQHGGVDAAAHEDHADRRPGHPQVVGERGGSLQVDAGPEDDRVLVRALGECALAAPRGWRRRSCRRPETERKSSALVVLLSTMMGIGSPEEVLLGDARAGLHLGVVVEQAEAELAVRRGEHDLLGLVLVHREGEQRERQALGGLRALRRSSSWRWSSWSGRRRRPGPRAAAPGCPPRRCPRSGR